MKSILPLVLNTRMDCSYSWAVNQIPIFGGHKKYRDRKIVILGFNLKKKFTLQIHFFLNWNPFFRLNCLLKCSTYLQLKICAVKFLLLGLLHYIYQFFICNKKTWKFEKSLKKCIFWNNLDMFFPRFYCPKVVIFA